MMQCPQTKAECADPDLCAPYNSCHPFATPRGLKKPPPPTLAEIERLLREYESAIDHVHYFEGLEYVAIKLEARAALIAAIQQLGVK